MNRVINGFLIKTYSKNCIAIIKGHKVITFDFAIPEDLLALSRILTKTSTEGGFGVTGSDVFKDTSIETWPASFYVGNEIREFKVILPYFYLGEIGTKEWLDRLEENVRAVMLAHPIESYEA